MSEKTHNTLSKVIEPKQSEIALRASEKKYRTIFDSVPVSIWEEDFSTVFDMLTEIRDSGVKDLKEYLHSHPQFAKRAASSIMVKDVNLISLRIFKAKSKEQLKQNLYAFFPDGDCESFEKELAAIWEKKTYFETEMQHATLSGEKLTIHLAMNFPDTREEFSSILVIKTDITERKIAEEMLKASEVQFRMVFDNSNVGKSMTLPTGELQCNKALADMLGYSREELNTKTWQMVTPPEDIPSVQANLDLLLKGKTDSVRLNKRYMHKDGSILWGDMSATMRRDNAGNPLHFITTVVDITERKKAEEALWEVQRQLMTLTNNLPGMVYRCRADQQWTMAFVSDRCYELTGYKPMELIDNKKISYESIIHPDDLDMVRRTTVSAGSRAFEISYRIITADGKQKWVWEQGQGVLGAEEKVAFYEGFITDISNQKDAEEARQQSLELLSVFVKNSPIYAFVKEVTETKSRVVFASENFKDMIGIPGSEMMGKSMEELFPPEFAAKMTRDDWAVVSNGRNLKIEEELDGRSYISIKFPIGFGSRNLLAGYTVDITDLKQTENQLRQLTVRQEAILGSIPDILMEVDENKVYTWANPAGVHFFGPDVLGHEAKNYFVGEQQVYEQVQPLFSGDEHTIYIESWQKRKDGEVRLLAWWCRVLKDINGHPIGSLSTARDITEERLAQEEIIALNTRLEQRVEERTRELREAQEQIVRQEKLALMGQLAGSVGHELRNPLGVISNAVYFLKMVNPDSDEKVKKYLAMIEIETKNAEKIISDLLEFARTKSIEREKINLKDLINRSLARRPTPMNIKISLSIPESLPMVLVDPRHIEQIFENLVVNAYQAMPEGGELKISAEAVRREKKPYVCVHVKDSGMGISSENIAKMFEPLFTTKPKGIGLGLAVCRKLAEINDGSIEVKSEYGKGADFILHFPIAGDK
jgi:PAS domain S-box-containing protein